MKRITLAVLMSALLCSTAAFAKNGADDPFEPCDDHGTDVCAIRAA